MSNERVTIKDIALTTGTSTSTVSLALRNDPRISTRVRETIQATAKEMGYRTNLLGSLLSTNNPKVLGVIADFTQELHISYIQQLTKAATSHGYHLITESYTNYARPEEALTALTQFNLNRVIAINPPAPVLKYHPQVIIGQDTSNPQNDLITSDNHRGMTQLVAHLSELGHREVFYFQGPKGPSAQARFNALNEASRKYRLKIHPVQAGDDFGAGHLAMTRLLAAEGFLAESRKTGEVPVSNTSLFQQISGLICYNDQCAQGALLALWKAGIRVPEELSVCGYDNSRLAASEAFNLTSVDRCVKNIARTAIERAIAWNEKKLECPEQIKVETSLVCRSSTASPLYLAR